MSKRRFIDVIDLVTTSSDEEHPHPASQCTKQGPGLTKPSQAGVHGRANGHQAPPDLSQRGRSRGKQKAETGEVPPQGGLTGKGCSKTTAEEGHTSKKARTGPPSNKVQDRVGERVQQSSVHAGCGRPSLPL